MKKIGVLVPQSKTYPTLGKDFVNGLKLPDSEDVTFIVEGTGMGENIDIVCEKIDKFVLQEDVDAIVGLFGDNGLAVAYEKVNSLQIPTIFARLGAYQDISIENNQYAFTLSYGLCESLTYLGEWLVKNDYKNIGVSGSFNDVGYGFIASLEKSLYEAGGAFSGHYTPPLNPRPDEANHLKEFYENVESDAVCQLYNGIFAEENVDYLEAAQEAIKVPLFFMPFALTEELLERTSKLTNEVYAVGSWLPVSLTGEPTSFDTAFHAKYSSYPSITGLVGYLAQQAMEQVLSHREGLLKGESFRMENDALSGVWGDDLRFTAPVKIWKMDTSRSSVVLKEIASSDENNELTTLSEGQQKGWHNAYLCY